MAKNYLSTLLKELAHEHRTKGKSADTVLRELYEGRIKNECTIPERAALRIHYENRYLIIPSGEVVNQFIGHHRPDLGTTVLPPFALDFSNQLFTGRLQFQDCMIKARLLLVTYDTDIFWCFFRMSLPAGRSFDHRSGDIQRAFMLHDNIVAFTSKYMSEDKYCLDELFSLLYLYFLSEGGELRKAEKPLGNKYSDQFTVATLGTDTPNAPAKEIDIAQLWEVRGHWRWQPIGAGRSKRKLIYIKGFVKGYKRLEAENPIGG